MQTINQYEFFMKKNKQTIMHTLSSKRQTSKASETQYIFTYEHHWYFQHASFTTRDRAQIKPGAWLMQSIVKQQPQHCALYTIHICYLDTQQRLMTVFTVCQRTTMQQLSAKQSALKLFCKLHLCFASVQIRDCEAKLASSTCHRQETDTVILELTH